jgi:hypothetical protein
MEFELKKPILVALLAFVFLASACSSDTETPTVSSSPQPSMEQSQQDEETLSETGAELSESSPDSDSRLLSDLLSDDQSIAGAALDEVLERNDERFIGVLIELMRANEIQILSGAGYAEHVNALEALSGESFGAVWSEWVLWYGGTDLEPPPGFTSWKGELLSKIDPRFGLFLKDEYTSTIRVEEIMWGGVLVDGIPALDNPTMITNFESSYLQPMEPVFGISINGDSRAYPLRILDWHEMANDVVGGVPLSLAYCTLCGAGVAFDGRASDGETYTFGSSGFLFRSNKLMYDRQTNTLWNQLTGEPVLGELVDLDVKLDLLPVVLTTWQGWLEQHPDTAVVSLDTGFSRYYIPGAAYGDYFSSDRTMFPVWQQSDLLDLKDRVYTLRIEGRPKAYPVDILVSERVINDALAGNQIVLVAQRGSVTVEGESLRIGEVTYDSGGEVRAFLRGDETFSPGDVPDEIVDSNGAIWLVTEEALLGPEGQSLPRVNGHLAYWFGWYAFFPNTLIYGVE